MRMFLRGLTVISTIAVISSLATTAMAQQVPVRVVQGTDGTLYVLQGSNSWTLVPDQLGDSDAAALTPGGEIDGTFPASLFSVPAAPPATPAQIRVDVNTELSQVAQASCDEASNLTNISKLIVSLASVDRPGGGQSIWHIGILNHASTAITLLGGTAYIVAPDGTKYAARAIDDPIVAAVDARTTLDVIPQQNNMPAGVYRLFIVTKAIIFPAMGQGCRNQTWSSTPVSLP